MRVLTDAILTALNPSKAHELPALLDAVAVRLASKSAADRDAALDTLGQLALIPACKESCVRTVQLLVDAGASVNVQAPAGGTTPLIAATMSNYFESVNIMRLLLDAGACPYFPTRSGMRALVAAARQRNADKVKLLLHHGVDADTAANDGTTALHVAVQRGYIQIAFKLVINGANPTICNSAGHSALTIRRYRHAADGAFVIASNAVRIRRRNAFQVWRTACYALTLTNFWWKAAGAGQHAPGAPGHRRAVEDYAREFQ